MWLKQRKQVGEVGVAQIMWALWTVCKELVFYTDKAIAGFERGLM